MQCLTPVTCGRHGSARAYQNTSQYPGSQAEISLCDPDANKDF